MEVQVRVRGSSSPDAVRSYVARRVRLALSRFVNRLETVRVGVSEAGDSRQGVIESSCRITAVVPAAQRIEVKEMDLDLYAAIDRATDQ